MGYLWMLDVSLVMVLLFNHGEAAPTLKFKKWDYNLKGDVLVIATGSLRFHGNHPMFPDVYTGEACRSVCLDTAGCNGWTVCTKKEGCGTGCKGYLQANPILKAPDDRPQSLPSSLKMSDLVRPGPYESLCSYSNNDAWNFGTCTLKKVPNTSNPEFWSKVPGEGWVSGTVQTPAKCKLDIAARSCIKCLSLPTTALTDQCLACGKKLNSVTTRPSPVVLSLIQAAPVTTDGCAACLQLTNPGTCLDCLYGNKKCADCALQQARLRTDIQATQPPPPPFDVKLCVDCTVANGAKTKEACMNCAQLTSKKTTCTSCVAAQKTRMCDFSNYSGGPLNYDCIPPEACSTCAAKAKVPKTCTDCLKRRPYNPDCVECARVTSDAVKQVTCYQCQNKTKTYSSETFEGAGCSNCVKLSSKEQIDTCINFCALRADLPLSVNRFLCEQCGRLRKTIAGQKQCYGCVVDNSNSNPGVCSNP